MRKGISGSVVVDGVTQANWKIYSFEFKNSFIQKYILNGSTTFIVQWFKGCLIVCVALRSYQLSCPGSSAGRALA